MLGLFRSYQMFSITKSRELDKMQTQDADVNRRHYGEYVKFYLHLYQNALENSVLQFYVTG